MAAIGGPPRNVPKSQWAAGRAWRGARLLTRNSIEVIRPTASWAYASGQRQHRLDGHLVSVIYWAAPRGRRGWTGKSGLEFLPEGPTGPDGESLGGGWRHPPCVAVRFKRPSGRRTRLSRARLGKAVGVPRGADDPQGPNRPGAGGFARRPPDGVLGGRPSQVRAILTGRPRQDRPPTTAEPAQHPAYWSPQATARPRPSRSTCPHRWQSTWQSVVARRTPGSGPVFAHHDSVAPVRRELAGSLLARGARRNGPEA
jgi:hypothetical protein